MSDRIIWTTETRCLGDLREWEKNPRQLSKHDAEHIKRSLDTFGLADPLIINRDNSLIGGHQRKRILADPDTLVDVRVPSRQLTEREAEELAIRLNKAQGSWDWDALANNWEMDTLIDWGFRPFELGIIDEGIDPNEEWKGMPDFEHEDKTAEAAFTIRVFLKDADDLAALGHLLGKDLTGRKFVWFGKQPIGDKYEVYDRPQT